MAGRLNALQFAAASAGLTLRDDAIKAARRVLVGGEHQADVARDVSEHRQTVHYWCKRVLDAWEVILGRWAAEVPPGWQVQILAAPPAEMTRIVAACEAERQNLIAKGG